MLDMVGCESPCAIPAHFAVIWGASLVILPASKIAPPVTKWSAEEVAIDAFHHLIYVTAVDQTYALLKWVSAQYLGENAQ